MASAPTAAQPQGTADGVVLPPHLAKLAAWLIENSFNDLLERMRRRTGTTPDIPHLSELRRLLAVAACGRPAAIVGSSARAPSFTTTAEAARVMRLSERTVRHLAATGRLIARKEGRDWAIDRQSAEDYQRTERTR
jgi:excisionase family DNA binding protein